MMHIPIYLIKTNITTITARFKKEFLTESISTLKIIF